MCFFIKPFFIVKKTATQGGQKKINPITGNGRNFPGFLCHVFQNKNDSEPKNSNYVVFWKNCLQVHLNTSVVIQRCFHISIKTPSFWKICNLMISSPVPFLLLMNSKNIFVVFSTKNTFSKHLCHFCS